ncbi:MAG: hypothetical protein Q9186_001131 [Xanthomendoza sp. 1 TL-2023]
MPPRTNPQGKAISALCSGLFAESLEIVVNDEASIKTTAGLVLGPLVGFYNGSQQGSTPNAELRFTDDAAASLFGALIDYWHYTGDEQYNRLAIDLLAGSIGANPPLSTDDQGSWALGAMSAAESDFPLKPLNGTPTWLGYAQRIFDVQVAQWDTQTCNGGVRWLFSPDGQSANGYNYKNSITNGILFQLAARLARYTGNQTYVEWANTAWDWTTSVNLITSDYRVYDGVDTQDNCTKPVPLQWSYTAGVFLYGSAVMYNVTNANPQWQNHTQSLFSRMAVDFFKLDSESARGAPLKVMVEVACESQSTCNYAQYGYKGLTAPWMGATIRTAPFLADSIAPALQDSAKAAIRHCSSKFNGVVCGSNWADTTNSKAYGFGPQLSAFGVLISNLASNSTPPVTAKTTTLQSSSGSVENTSQSSTLHMSASPLGRSSRFQKLNKSMEQRPVTRSQASFSTAADTAKTTTAASKSPTTPFPFLALPPEIRNMIYRYIVRFPKGVVRTTKPTKSRLQLWYVNHQIYDEASAIFYSINTFKFISGYVRKGEDPFGPRLDRIERCYLHVALTRDTKRGNAFTQWFIKEFATALLGWKSLKYLIVRISDFQFDVIKPLQWLTGIDFVLIHTCHFRYMGRRPGLFIDHVTRQEQRLERLMMSDGKSKTALMEGLGEVYMTDLPLSTELRGQALQKAQRHGGWANSHQLYDFLGV